MSEETEVFSALDGVVRAGDANVGKVKALVYGEPGTGKTSLGATMPQPSLHLLSEGHGDLSVKRVQPDAEIIYIKNHQHLLKILDKLTYRSHKYKSVCLDSLTDMQEMVMKNMKGDKVAAKMVLQDWGTLQELTKDVVKRFRDLDLHVCVICLSADKQEEGGPLIRGPLLTGQKFPKKLPSFFNIVGYQIKRTPDDSNVAIHRTVMDAGEGYITKTHPALDPVELPDFSVWVDKINSHEGGTMPEEVTHVERPKDPEAEAIAEAEAIIANEEVKALFDKLGAPNGKRIATARKYGSIEKVLEKLRDAAEDAA